MNQCDSDIAQVLSKHFLLCSLKYNTAKDLLRHTKRNHNHPFEQYCVSVRLPWLVETTGSSPVHANQTDPKCGNCDFTVKVSISAVPMILW